MNKFLFFVTIIFILLSIILYNNIYSHPNPKVNKEETTFKFNNKIFKSSNYYKDFKGNYILLDKEIVIPNTTKLLIINESIIQDLLIDAQ